MRATSKKIPRLPFEKQAERALKDAVRRVIRENARLGLPVYVGRDGKVVQLSADELRKLARRRP
jgi:hypothetical protein